MAGELLFALELGVSGLLVGVMYALVALGFVLIYKASAVFNFAQGAMTLFAALALVGFIPRFGMAGALVAAALVLTLVWFFQKTTTGLGLRAVSDDHEAALAVGIPLRQAWAVTWAIAGIVAMVAGILWGTRLGVQFSLSLVALKALPVLIIGGLESIPGAILGGLIVGATERLVGGFIDPYVGGGVKDFSPYLLALVFLIFRPYGLFGREIIERV